VTVATGAEVALGMVAADPAPPPAVLVAGIDASGRDGVDGLAVAEAARCRRPTIGVVYVTRRPSRLDGRALGARDRFLPRPVAPGALVRAVHALAGMAHPPGADPHRPAVVGRGTPSVGGRGG
jgi:DNA-binding response OmpR family regulator